MAADRVAPISRAGTLLLLVVVVLWLPTAALGGHQPTQLPPWAQCGGESNCPRAAAAASVSCGDRAWSSVVCPSGYSCARQDNWYHQCRPERKGTQQLGAFDQCGGRLGCSSSDSPCEDAAWRAVACPGGYTCSRTNEFFWQCRPDSTEQPRPANNSSTSASPRSPAPSLRLWDQCSQPWTSAGSCPQGSSCVRKDEHYSQCRPPNAGPFEPPSPPPSPPPAPVPAMNSPQPPTVVRRAVPPLPSPAPQQQPARPPRQPPSAQQQRAVPRPTIFFRTANVMQPPVMPRASPSPRPIPLPAPPQPKPQQQQQQQQQQAPSPSPVAQKQPPPSPPPPPSPSPSPGVAPAQQQQQRNTTVQERAAAAVTAVRRVNTTAKPSPAGLNVTSRRQVNMTQLAAALARRAVNTTNVTRIVPVNVTRGGAANATAAVPRSPPPSPWPPRVPAANTTAPPSPSPRPPRVPAANTTAPPSSPLYVPANFSRRASPPPAGPPLPPPPVRLPAPATNDSNSVALTFAGINPDKFQHSGASSSALQVISNLTGVPAADIRVSYAPAAPAGSTAGMPRAGVPAGSISARRLMQAALPGSQGTVATYTLPSAQALQRLQATLSPPEGSSSPALADSLTAAGVAPQLVAASAAGKQLPLQPAAPSPPPPQPAPLAAQAAQAAQAAPAAPPPTTVSNRNNRGRTLGAVIGGVAGGLVLLLALLWVLAAAGVFRRARPSEVEPSIKPQAGDARLLLQQHPAPASDGDAAAAAGGTGWGGAGSAAAAATAARNSVATSTHATVASWVQQLTTHDGVTAAPLTASKAPAPAAALAATSSAVDSSLDMASPFERQQQQQQLQSSRGTGPQPESLEAAAAAAVAAADASTAAAADGMGRSSTRSWRGWVGRLTGRGDAQKDIRLPVYGNVGLLRATYSTQHTSGTGAPATAAAGSQPATPRGPAGAGTAGAPLGMLRSTYSPSGAAALLAPCSQPAEVAPAFPASPLGALRATYSVTSPGAAVNVEGNARPWGPVDPTRQLLQPSAPVPGAQGWHAAVFARMSTPLAAADGPASSSNALAAGLRTRSSPNLAAAAAAAMESFAISVSPSPRTSLDTTGSNAPQPGFVRERIDTWMRRMQGVRGNILGGSRSTPAASGSAAASAVSATGWQLSVGAAPRVHSNDYEDSSSSAFPYHLHAIAAATGEQRACSSFSAAASLGEAASEMLQLLPPGAAAGSAAPEHHSSTPRQPHEQPSSAGPARGASSAAGMLTLGRAPSARAVAAAFVRGAAAGDVAPAAFFDADEERSSNSSTTWYESTAFDTASAGRGSSASYHSAWAGSSRSAEAAAAAAGEGGSHGDDDEGDTASDESGGGSGFAAPRSAAGSFLSAAGSLHSAASNASFRTTRSQASTGSSASGAAPIAAAGEPGGGGLDMFVGGTPTAGAVAEPALASSSARSERGLQSALYRNAASFPAAFLPQFPAAGGEDSEDEGSVLQ